MLKNKLPYNARDFEQKFKQTEIYQRLAEQYDNVIFDGNFPNEFTGNRHTKLQCPWGSKNYLTPKSMIGSRHFQFGRPWSSQDYWSHKTTARHALLEHSVVDAIPFYYLDFLLETKPEKIYDIGCGYNFFKHYIPCIIGVGAESPDSKYFFGDEHGFVDDTYIKQHQQSFPHAFSINALHFISITQMRQRVIDFMSMIQPGGRGYLVMTSWVLLEHTSTVDFTPSQLIDLVSIRDLKSLDNFFRRELDDMPFEYLCVDIDISPKPFTVTGNMHLVMQNS